MLKLSLEQVGKIKTTPYFEIRYWNIPKDSMKTYTEIEIESNDLSEAKRYLTHLFLLKRKIEKKEILVNDLEKIIVKSDYSKYFYKVDDELKIEVVLKNEHKDNPDIVDIDLWYAKYFDEYGVEYNIKIEEISEILEKF